MNTKQWIDFIIHETEGALTVLYSYMAFYEAVNDKDKEFIELMNKNASFWKVYAASLQMTLFIYLGRLSDDSKDVKSFAQFRQHCIKHVGDFSKDVYLKRNEAILNQYAKPKKPASFEEVKADFLKEKTFPDQSRIGELSKIASKSNKYLRSECKTIRSKVMAHAILIEENDYNHLFENVKLQEIEKALLPMWSVGEYLRGAYMNGRPVKCEVMKYPNKDHVNWLTRKAIKPGIEPKPFELF